MIIANSRSSQQGGNSVPIANVEQKEGTVQVVQNVRFPLPVDGVLDINPKRIFTDTYDVATTNVDNRSNTRFRLPPRYRGIQDDDRDDAHGGNDGQNISNVLPTSTVIPVVQRSNRLSLESNVMSEHPMYMSQHRQYLHQRELAARNTPAATSWTAAAPSANTDSGQVPTWRRHYLPTTRDAIAGTARRTIPTDAANESGASHHFPSKSVRHEVLLAELGYASHSESLPSHSMVHHQQQGMRYFLPTMEMMHNRQKVSSGIEHVTAIPASTRMASATSNTSHQNYRRTSSSERSRQVTGSIRPALDGPHTFAQETVQWRNPRGQIHVHRSGHELSTGRDRTQKPVAGEIHQLDTAVSPSTLQRRNLSLMASSTIEQSRSHAKNAFYGQKRILTSIAHQQHNQNPAPPPSLPIFKKVKGFDKLDLLCTATLEIGEMHDNPTGCSCPKSKCVALYCDCFKAGRRCHINRCSCMNCKNTIAESGIDGARTAAIRNILARNPRAFNTAGMGNPLHKLPKGEVACNCVRSKCLKLYCTCFHHGKVCRPNICTCVGCENNSDNDVHNSNRQAAIQNVMEKNVDAFLIKPKTIGQGCACKNNKCLRKYCECYRTGLKCTINKCTCRDCENQGTHH